MKPNASYGGPIGRISGAELVVDIKCGNQQTADIETRGLTQDKICTVAVSSALQHFAIAEERDYFGEQGGYRQRVYHGLRIKLRTRGTLAVFDLNSLYTNAIEAA